MTIADSIGQGLEGIIQQAFRSLQRPITMPAITNLNLLWHAGSSPHDTMNVHPNTETPYGQFYDKGTHTSKNKIQYKH
jgi:hypothetical protein